jgi:hypothetical protein
LRERLGVYTALQFLGEVFHIQDDAETAISLFTVALEGFTTMDVHVGAAECMRRLGDIHEARGDHQGAVQLWRKSHFLFKRSSQMKRVAEVEERLAGVISETDGEMH